MNFLNILFTSVGQRGYLLEYFRRELNGIGKIVATNSEKFCSGFNYADKSYLVPYSSDKKYIPRIKEICKECDINIIFSLHDIDTYYISKVKKQFNEIGVKLLMPSFEIVKQCLDKNEYKKILSGTNVLLPLGSSNKMKIFDMIDDNKLCYPLIIKPRYGYGSNFINIVNNKKELDISWKYISRKLINDKNNFSSNISLICQQYIKGQEYGLDIFNDLNGKFIGCSLRKKILMKNGETFIGEVVKPESKVIKFCKKFSKYTKHLGIVDIDLIISKNEKKIYLLDINPRFGGGYPISHESGVNAPKVFISLAKGEQIDYQFLNPKIYNSIFFKEFITSQFIRNRN